MSALNYNAALGCSIYSENVGGDHGILGLDEQMYAHMVCKMSEILRNAIIVAPGPVKFLSHSIPVKHMIIVLISHYNNDWFCSATFFCFMNILTSNVNT